MEIDVGIGMTLKIWRDGKDTYQTIRPEFMVRGIQDPEKGGKEGREAIKKQLKRAKAIAFLAWDEMSDWIEVKVMEELGQSPRKENLEGGDVTDDSS